MHSGLLVTAPWQARHCVVPVSQIGAVGVVQSVSASAQPPHAPLPVHTRLPGQLSGLLEQPAQLRVLALQIGELPLQPALVAGSQRTQLPSKHCSLPSLRPAQSLASRHSEQRLVVPVVPITQTWPAEQAGPLPQPHTRLLQESALVTLHPVLQSVHRAADVFLHSFMQQRSLLAHCVSCVHCGPASATGPPPSG
jgi:hypothetical protein